MRTVAVPWLLLTVSCSTNYSGLQGVTGTGGSQTGNTGGIGVGGAGAVGAGGQAATGGTGAGGAGNRGGSGGVAGSGGAGNQAGGAGGAGGQGTGAGVNGTPCSTGPDCMSGYCFDGTCCASDCSGACRSCANSTGTCAFAARMTDPRQDCPQDAQNPCGSVGYCNGSGACAMAPAAAVCDTTPRCDSANASVIADSICNGLGTCVANSAQSCNGFLCAAGACGTSCVDDSGCAGGGYCSAATCLVNTPNLAGNGDLETGTLTGWSAVQGGVVSLSSTAASGYAHGGQYSVEQDSRSVNYSGPGYALPTGIGQYAISAWVMQNQDTMSNEVVQVRIQCRLNTYYATVQSGSGYGMWLQPGVWTQFNATVDFNNVTPAPLTADCFPTSAAPSGPGLIRSAYVYANQVNADSPTPYQNPNLYMDDLVIQVTDGHNLVGNPNFEAGLVDGWSVNGVGASTLGVSSTYANTGAKSLWLNGRTQPGSGIAYALPIGAARYSVLFNVMQSGTLPHALALEAAYSCIGSSTVITPTNMLQTVTAPPSTWEPLQGTFVLPPADAPPGCQLSTAAVWVTQAEAGDCATVECPDLFVDDASITLQ